MNKKDLCFWLALNVSFDDFVTNKFTISFDEVESELEDITVTALDLRLAKAVIASDNIHVYRGPIFDVKGVEIKVGDFVSCTDGEKLIQGYVQWWTVLYINSHGTHHVLGRLISDGFTMSIGYSL